MNYDKDYRKNGFVQYDAALELLAHIPFKPTNLLDIGCGSGQVTALICDQRKPCRVTGIDSSPEMIKEAQLLYPLPNVTYTESSIEGLSTRDQFDVITANSSFQWFSDYSKAFKNIRSSLAEDGIFVLQASCRQQWCPTINHLVDVFFDALYPELKPHFHFPCMHLENIDEYRKFFLIHGFTASTLYIKEFEYRLSPDDFLKVFKSGGFKAYGYEQWFDVPLPERYTQNLLDYFVQFTVGKSCIPIVIPRLFAQLKPIP